MFWITWNLFYTADHELSDADLTGCSNSTSKVRHAIRPRSHLASPPVEKKFEFLAYLQGLTHEMDLVFDDKLLVLGRNMDEVSFKFLGASMIL